jgi:hypothetical protein
MSNVATSALDRPIVTQRQVQLHEITQHTMFCHRALTEAPRAYIDAVDVA